MCFFWLIRISVVLCYCAIVQSQSVQAQTRVAQRNQFYVPKPSTVPPTTTAASKTPRPIETKTGETKTGETKTGKIIYTRLSGFNIPFKIDSSNEAFVEVHLYTSANQGATWDFYNRQPTDASEFPFQANGAGEYWFAIKTLDRNRRLIPEGDPQPELRIIVDTTKPKLEMTAAADPAGRIVCRWNASDTYLRPQSLELLYKPTFTGEDEDSDRTQWQSVTVNTPTYAPGGIYVDQLAFWPETTVQTLDVRIAIADEAGNIVSADRRLSVPRPSWRHSSHATARPTDRPAVDPSRVPSSVTDSPVRNMKCEDGSCEIPPVASNDPQWKRAFYSNLRPASPENYAANETAADRKTVPAAIFRQNPYSKSPTANASNTTQDRQPPSTADQRTAMLVGSQPEYAAPPTPAGWTLNNNGQESRPMQTQPTQPFRNFQQPPSSKFGPPQNQSSYTPPPQPSPDPRQQGSNSRGNDTNSDVWQSEVEHDARQPQTSVGSTLSPDHRMLPLASGERLPNRTDLILPNPNTTKDAGDQWVSNSSTNFPNNQYKGLDNRGLPNNVNSEFMPGSTCASFITHLRGNRRPASDWSDAQHKLHTAAGPTAPARLAVYLPANANPIQHWPRIDQRPLQKQHPNYQYQTLSTELRH